MFLPQVSIAAAATDDDVIVVVEMVMVSRYNVHIHCWTKFLTVHG